jgi:hypothetical protein
LTSPRPYVAAAAASILAALYFVPSATASPDQSAFAQSASSHQATSVSAPAAQQASLTDTSAQSAQSDTSAQSAQSAPSGQNIGLADTGSIDTTPYLVGGAAFLVAGAGLVLNAGRRSRQDAGLGEPAI